MPFVSDRTDSDGAISVNVAFDGFNDNFSIVFGSGVTVGSIVDKQGTAFTDYELNDKVLKFNNPTQGNEYTIAATVAGYSYTVKVTPEYEFMPDYVTIIKSPSRKQTLILLGVYVVIFGVATYFLLDKISGIAESLIRRGTGLSGRDMLYEEGVELFKQHPIFGVGIGYIGTGQYPITTMQIYLYYSTAIQIIASTGAIGIAAYAYYYATRIYLLFRNGGHKFNLFMLAVRIGFEGYSMMDTGTFVPFPNMMLVIILTFILEINPSDKRFEGVADEYNSLFPKRNKLAKNAK